MMRENKNRFGLGWLKSGKWRPDPFVLDGRVNVRQWIWSLFFLFLFLDSSAFAQPFKSQIIQPSFLQANEEVKEVINNNVYLVSEIPKEISPTTINGKTYSSKEKISNINTYKLYFTDGNGKVISTFNIFPSTSVLNASVTRRYSHKFITVCRSYTIDQKEFVDGFVLNYSGKVLWHIPGKEIIGNIFPIDKNDSLMMVDVWKGFLKIYNIHGTAKAEKYFTEQNDKKFTDLAVENIEDVNFQGRVESSEGGNYVAIFRASTEFKDFQNELILLDSNGNVIFQNRAPQDKIGIPLKIFENLKIIVVLGDVNGRLTDRRYRSRDTYYGLDFTGKELWELDGEKYFLNPSDLKDTIVKLNNVEKTMDKKGRHVINSKFTPSDRMFDIKTGEIK